MEIERGDADAPRHGSDRPEPADQAKSTNREKPADQAKPTNRPESADRENQTDDARGDSDSGFDSDSDSDSGSDSGANAVLADPERLASEHQTYRAIVDREYGAARDQWVEAVPELRGAWEKIREKYGQEEREAPAPQAGDGAWHGKGGRTLDAAQNEEIDRGYARIREVGERTIIPGVLSVEAEDPSRSLAGFDNRFKGEERLKEKVADRIRSKGSTPEEALARIPDVVRFTYEYGETTYTAGVQQDLQRLGAKGFTQLERRNTWDDDQYKGINSRWREPESGVIFEVQFHTHASLEAKELTHGAYERIRSITNQSSEADRETVELKEFQRRVNSMIPIPPGVADIDDYPPGGK